MEEIIETLVDPELILPRENSKELPVEISSVALLSPGCNLIFLI
jgi:hypothetical protein